MSDASLPLPLPPVDPIREGANKLGYPDARPLQREVLEPMFAGRDVLAILPTSAGKCFGRGTPILMFDGSSRSVEDVVQGDLLMGPDSRPRKVVGTTRGSGPLFVVKQLRGDSYVVNEDHVLSLQKTLQKKNPGYPSHFGGKIVNISVREWLESSKWFKHIHKGWKTGVDFASVPIHDELPPYLLGLWLGDGDTRSQVITNMEPEVERYLSDYSNSFRRALQSIGLLGNKRIPKNYLVNDRQTRLEVLAGFIDSDGALDHPHLVDFALSPKPLVEDVVFLARSLGFGGTNRWCEKSCQNGFTGRYKRISITGDISQIPTRVQRKAPSVKSRTDTMRTAIDVQPVGNGEYFGFEVDGDHLFLLADFTVTHNSLLYQLPAVQRKGPVVVISPLVALMNDQVDRCREQGIAAYAVHSHCSASEKHRAATAVEEGRCPLLYMSPERLQGLDRAYFGEHPPQMFAIDEAHCVSEWGHDFRPAYAKIGRNLDRFGPVQRVAMTATATPKVADQICSVVGKDRTFDRVVRSPDRPNIRYAFAGARVPIVRMVQYVELPALVYGGTRRSVEEAARELRAAGFRAGHYHAGMEKTERRQTEHDFREGKLEIVAATCAFGMGIDHTGIRAVLHLEVPTSLEAFVQESGRAGRDGRPSISLCRASVDTLDTALTMSLMTWPDPRTVKAFREKLVKIVRSKKDRWEGEDRLQVTNKDLSHQIGMQAEEVGACLRVLDDASVIRRVSYADKAAKVWLLKDVTVRVRSQRQRQVLERLAEHADSSGEIVGTVAFFLSMGFDEAECKRLSTAGAIRYEWAERAQVIELRDVNGAVDDAMLLQMRARAVNRIRACRTFLQTKTCRRKFILEYFESEAESVPDGPCCDRCSSSKTVTT